MPRGDQGIRRMLIDHVMVVVKGAETMLSKKKIYLKPEVGRGRVDWSDFGL